MGSFGELGFEPGPVSITPGPTAVRHSLHADALGGGEQLVVSGRAARTLVQQGAWLGDTPQELRTMLRQLEDAMDGRPRTLTDDQGGAWPEAVLVGVQERSLQRVGVRWRLTFLAKYIQPTWEEAGLD